MDTTKMLKAELDSGQVDVPINPQPIIIVFFQTRPHGSLTTKSWRLYTHLLGKDPSYRLIWNDFYFLYFSISSVTTLDVEIPQKLWVLTSTYRQPDFKLQNYFPFSISPSSLSQSPLSRSCVPIFPRRLPNNCIGQFCESCGAIAKFSWHNRQILAHLARFSFHTYIQ